MNKIGDVKEGDLVDFEFSGKTTTVLVNGKLVADNIGGKKLLTLSCESGWAKTRLTTSSKRACWVSDLAKSRTQNETGTVAKAAPVFSLFHSKQGFFQPLTQVGGSGIPLETVRIS